MVSNEIETKPNTAWNAAYTKPRATPERNQAERELPSTFMGADSKSQTSESELNGTGTVTERGVVLCV